MDTTPRRRGTKEKRSNLDPRQKAIAEQVFKAMTGAGVSGAQLAARAGVDQSHLSKWFRAEAGLSVEQMLNVLTALGLGWGIGPNEPGDIRTVNVAGTVDAHGIVKLLGGVPTMPAVFVIDGDRGPFKKGDRVLLEDGGWTAGAWVMVAHPDGLHRLHRCEDRNGLRLLVSAEAVIYDEKAHVIVGVATDRVERLPGV